ncbi:MAG TPA: serine hydroxymethyltransferase [Anaerolineae bacterium]|nr:serine hydroxymethyltransferase [Anaerolineae bacterium]
MSDYFFLGDLSKNDPEVKELIQIETERQFRKLILIPSESSAPLAVRESLSSSFQNIYAEGYPNESMRLMQEANILDYPARLAHYRRYSDPRYYKGVEYVDILESLARRRCAELFATDLFQADDLFINVQPLSGAPANNAVYQALIDPGDTIMGMNLFHGGHLTHGSSVNRSGKLYNVVHYGVDPETEQINYGNLRELASEHKPRIIIAGYSSYPWIPNWKKFRVIADSVGAYLFADISHIAGLIAAKVIPSPIDHAHIITFTTHKTLCGPRGACIITTDSSISRKIDRAVFPGEQGGPHAQVFSAMATTFKLAQTDQFCKLQSQIVTNCITLSNQLCERGILISFGGTNSHLLNIDCKSIKGKDGTPLSGDMAVRIFDIAGLVANRNTIPGDKSALKASGVRLGTPWVTQRGLVEEDMVKIADIIADLLYATEPYKIDSSKGKAIRAKVDFKTLEQAKIRVRELAEKAGKDIQTEQHKYPHFFYYDDFSKSRKSSKTITFHLHGKNIRQYLNYCFSSDIEALKPGESQPTQLNTTLEIINGNLTALNHYHFHFSVDFDKANLTAAWLRDLSDGYIHFDDDLYRRIPGPIIVEETQSTNTSKSTGEIVCRSKPFYINIPDDKKKSLPLFNWEGTEPKSLYRTPLYKTHVESGARMVPFAGWEMPVWYSSVVEEHLATRKAAGLFDVAHMGIFQAEGPDACVFLDSVCSNDIGSLEVGESCYTHFLDPYANVIDDTLIYRHGIEEYLIVVNASNDAKDWAWFNAVINGEVLVDPERPWARAFGRNVTLRNLHDPKEGKDMRVDLALQGPKSKEILLSLNWTSENLIKIKRLKRTQLCKANLGEINLIISRTGYTGEKISFELFVRPTKAPLLWNMIIEKGQPLGLKTCGLGARDSLRTEAGLPLYGHEMGGDLNLGVGEGGFGSYVKVYKPWFIGRNAFIKKEKGQKGIVCRFRFNDKRVRMAHLGDPVMDEKGKVIGTVTSCAIDKDEYLTGQAFLNNKYAKEGTPIFIYQGKTQIKGISPSALNIGDRIPLPKSAKVIKRFPRL